MKITLDLQPIDTDPKDGKPFFGFNGIRFLIASWCEPAREGGEGEFLDDRCQRIEPPLTHRAAMPDPSEVSA